MKRTSANSSFPVDVFPKPLLIVLSGSSGAGKDTVLAKLKESSPSLKHITTVTTRLPRPAEIDGVHYYFVSEEKFKEMIKKDELLEWAQVYGNWYGVPHKPVKQALSMGQDIIIKVDIQGAATIKKKIPQAVFIFLLPESLEKLSQRLSGRSTESSGDLALRLKVAEDEIKQLHLFDYKVVNKEGDVDIAVTRIKAIMTAEKCRVTSREIDL